MWELIGDINDKTREPIVEERPALAGFYYKDGYTLSCTDLGKKGVKIELIHKQEGRAAIILPPEKTEECSRWLWQRNRNLQEELSEILKRLLKEKRMNLILKRGDKSIIKDVLKLLKDQQAKH